jgi:hypothetical protein
MEQLKSFARWLAFLPAAFLGAWAAWILSKAFNGTYIESSWFIPQVVARGAVDALASAATGAAFVYAGAKTAPAQQLTVAYFLGTLGLVIVAVCEYYAVLMSDYWAIWGGAWMLLGLIGVTGAASTGELQLDTSKIATE